MKRLLIGPVILVLASAAAAENRFFLSAGAGYMRPDDAAYRAIYGNQAIYPELQVRIRLTGGLCLTGSAGRLKKSGTTPGLGLPTSATQSYYAIGVGYLLRISPSFCMEAGGGMAGLSFREEALDKWVKGKHPGIQAEIGILMAPEDERVFVGLTAAYLAARVPGPDLEPIGTQDVRLGGLRIAVSVGLQLFGGN